MGWGTRTLNSGGEIPCIAFGTAYTSKTDLEGRILLAIQAGFRHFDTAEGKAYDNEKELGEALARSGLPRSELFITTKWSNFEEHGPIAACESSLKRLGLDYVDLYLIHNLKNCRGDIPGAWKQMEEVQRRGLARSIGVSNFDLEGLQILLSSCTMAPAVNQIYLNPNNVQAMNDVLAAARENQIITEAYWLLRPLTEDGSEPQPVVDAANSIARSHDCSADTVLLAWANAKGVIPITSSSSFDRLAGYMLAANLSLDDTEVRLLDEAGSRANGTLPWNRP